MNNSEYKRAWNEAVSFFETRFGRGIDIDGILFLIGVQELGKGKVQLSKEEKTDVIHVAVCTLLEPYGYYEFTGTDPEGWPHFKQTMKLPHLRPLDQQKLIKEAIIDYVESQKLSNVPDSVAKQEKIK